ncbi:hypothetical protein [Pseudarthrobacter sp. MDT3-1]
MLPDLCAPGAWWPPGCGLVSQAQNGALSAFNAFLAGILEGIASWLWSFISGAFGASNVDDSQWAAVQGLTGWWLVVMATPLVVAMILQLLSGLIAQQSRRIWRALIGGLMAIPAVGAAVYMMQTLTRVSDEASTALLETLGSDPYVVFMRLFGFERAPAGSANEWKFLGASVSTTPSALSGTLVITVFATLIIWILAFILMCSMIFRSFALIVLGAVAPVALMMMPWEKTKSWMARWCEVVVALLLAKPLAATILAVAVKLFSDSTSFAGIAAGAVGMTVACAAPLLALKLVGFAGGELSAAAGAAGGGQTARTMAGFSGRQLGQQIRSHHLSLGHGGGSGLSPVPSTPRPLPARVSRPAATIPRPSGAAGAAAVSSTQLQLLSGPRVSEAPARTVERAESGAYAKEPASRGTTSTHETATVQPAPDTPRPTLPAPKPPAQRPETTTTVIPPRIEGHHD